MTRSPRPPSATRAETTFAKAEQLAAGWSTHAEAADAAGALPSEDIEQLRSSGLIGLMVPTRLGGLGASFEEYAEIAMTLGAGSGASALVFNMHASVTGAMALMPDALVRAIGGDETYFARRDEMLTDAARGALYCVAMSERGAGARLSAIETQYEPTGGGFSIRGTKTFVSGAVLADAFLVTARSRAEPSRVSLFLVDARAGTQVERTWDSLGMRASSSDDVHFDARVGREALLGSAEGLAPIVARLMPQWLVASYAAVYVGVARATLAAACAYLQSRGLERLAAVRSRVGRADAAIVAAQLAVVEAARRVGSAPGVRETNQAVYRAKLLAGDTAALVASSLLEAAGTAAMRRGHVLERLFRDARCGALQPASSDLCADWLGVAALGGDPDEGTELPRW